MCTSFSSLQNSNMPKASSLKKKLVLLKSLENFPISNVTNSVIECLMTTSSYFCSYCLQNFTVSLEAPSFIYQTVCHSMIKNMISLSCGINIRIFLIIIKQKGWRVRSLKWGRSTRGIAKKSVRCCARAEWKNFPRFTRKNYCATLKFRSVFFVIKYSTL